MSQSTGSVCGNCGQQQTEIGGTFERPTELSVEHRTGGWHRPGDTRSLRSGFRTVPTFGGSDLIGSRAGPVDRVVDEWVHQHSGRHESIGTRALPFLMTPTVPTGDH